MIIGENRPAVIENIRRATENGDFNIKVETTDPVLTVEQSDAIIHRFLERRNTLPFKFKSFCARRIARIATSIINKNTKIVGMENISDIKGGAIITSNHFSPLENTAVRFVTEKQGRKRLNIVCQETNLAMPGIIGFLMNYADIVPISENYNYIKKEFPSIISNLIEKGECILIYPEQEMWFNYCKPRPFKRGAYYYAAKFGAPIISLFVEMHSLDEADTDEFNRIQYIVHVLKPLFPDSEKSVKENSVNLCKADYQQKKSAYEAAYGKPLDYTFESSDIAGWRKNNHE